MRQDEPQDSAPVRVAWLLNQRCRERYSLRFRRSAIIVKLEVFLSPPSRNSTLAGKVSSMETRLLTADDAEAWWQLRLEMLRNDPFAFADSTEEHLATTVESVRKRLAANDPQNNFVVGLFERSKLMGTAGFFRRPHHKESHKGHVWGVYVSPELRGKGAGKALMREIIRRAREIEGLEQITLVASARLPPQKLYQSVGFESYGIEPHSLKIGNEYVDDVLMVLWL